MKCHLLFPGQGAQYAGMGKTLADKSLFKEAEEIVNRPFAKEIFEGSSQFLMKTENSQLAIFVTSAAILDNLKQSVALDVSATAGLSLGEYSALYAAGKLTFAQALLLVQKRAAFMSEACEKTPGAMSAVIGLSSQKVEAIIDPLKDVWVANFNTPQQTVVTGTVDAIAEATSQLRAAGAKRVIALKVQGAFHSPLMQQAADRFAPYVYEAEFSSSKVNLFMNVSAEPCCNIEQIKSNLVAQITSPILWYETIENMPPDTLLLEVGPGKTLTRMNRQSGKQACSVENQDGILQLKTQTFC